MNAVFPGGLAGTLDVHAVLGLAGAESDLFDLGLLSRRQRYVLVVESPTGEDVEWSRSGKVVCALTPPNRQPCWS